MSGSKLLSVAEVDALLQAVFLKAGFTPAHAGAIARTVMAGERDGCTSHGVYRVDLCLRTLRAGKVSPDFVPAVKTDGGPLVRVDAGGGFSCLAFETALPAFVAAARRHGMAALVVNNCVHFSALWPEIEAISSHGLAALAMCPSYATVAPAGGKKPLLGTNPLAFGWPRRGGDPYVFDFATSVAARGEIELHRIAGKALPEGWAIDADGQPTTDPAQALAGAMLPFGAHKGSAISTMIELLAAVMIGDLTSADALDAVGTTTFAPRHGELILAFDPARFDPSGAANDRGEDLLNAIVAQDARLPSQRRYAARKKAFANGIRLSSDVVARLERFRDLGLAALAEAT